MKRRMDKTIIKNEPKADQEINDLIRKGFEICIYSLFRGRGSKLSSPMIRTRFQNPF